MVTMMPEKTHSDLNSAFRTIDSEIDTINKLRETLSDGSLTNALDLMQKATGRIIITGMGKSGHIGKKLRRHWPQPELRHSLSIRQKQATVIWE